MKKTNGDNSWLCYFMAVVLILAGVFVEPLAAVLGILIVVTSLISRLIESNNYRKMTRDAAEEVNKAKQQVQLEKMV